MEINFYLLQSVTCEQLLQQISEENRPDFVCAANDKAILLFHDEHKASGANDQIKKVLNKRSASKYSLASPTSLTEISQQTYDEMTSSNIKDGKTKL